MAGRGGRDEEPQRLPLLPLLRPQIEKRRACALPQPFLGTSIVITMPRPAGAANLYPELLLALVGHTGGAFVSSPHGPEHESIVLGDVVDWVTPPER